MLPEIVTWDSLSQVRALMMPLAGTRWILGNGAILKFQIIHVEVSPCGPKPS